MTIETKFDKGEKAYIINYDKVICLPVNGIEYNNGTINYSFISSKAVTGMDKDTVIYRSEESCFKSITDLANYYEDAINRKKN